jgi:polysaccharide biosynthesis/export protein
MYGRVLFILLLNALVLQGCVPDDHGAITSVNDNSVYRLAPGDHVRLIVFDQPALSNVYSVDATGNVSIPLAGTVKAEGKTTRQLEAAIVGRLREENLVTEAKAAVEVAIYRPISILGEVKAPGRFPYAPGMTIEAAVALAGGYTIHANKENVRVTRTASRGEAAVEDLPPTATVMPGDSIYVHERWF